MAIRGNADKMLAREETMESEHLKGELQKVLPVVNTAGSDSAMLDNTLEFLVMSGMDLPLAVMITIPEPWANNSIMSQKKKDFYQYYATMMEPWDGPASILFSDFITLLIKKHPALPETAGGAGRGKLRPHGPTRRPECKAGRSACGHLV